MILNNKTKFTALVIFATIGCTNAVAQISIEKEPYRSKAIPFSIAIDAPSKLNPVPVVALKVAPVEKWELLLSDKTIRQTFAKWSQKSGHQIIWEITKDIPVVAEATLTGSFEQVLEQVLESLRYSDYPIEAIIYDNSVVRFIKTTPNTAKVEKTNE